MKIGPQPYSTFWNICNWVVCPKTTKFGPKLTFLVNLGQAMKAYSVPCWWVGWWLWQAGCISQDTYLLYIVDKRKKQIRHDRLTARIWRQAHLVLIFSSIRLHAIWSSFHYWFIINDFTKYTVRASFLDTDKIKYFLSFSYFSTRIFRKWCWLIFDHMLIIMTRCIADTLILVTTANTGGGVLSSGGALLAEIMRNFGLFWLF